MERGGSASREGVGQKWAQETAGDGAGMGLGRGRGWARWGWMVAGVRWGSSHFSWVPVTDAVHVQGLLRQVSSLWQGDHIPASQLQVPSGPLSDGQLFLLCLPGAQAEGTQARLHWRLATPYPSFKRTRGWPSRRQGSLNQQSKRSPSLGA